MEFDHGFADRAPATLVNLIGKKQYTRCATDIYNFSQVGHHALGWEFFRRIFLVHLCTWIIIAAEKSNEMLGAGQGRM